MKPAEVLARHSVGHERSAASTVEPRRDGSILHDIDVCVTCQTLWPCVPAEAVDQARQLQAAQERVAAWTAADKAYVDASLHRMSQHTKAARRAEEAASEVKFQAEVALHELIDPAYAQPAGEPQ